MVIIWRELTNCDNYVMSVTYKDVIIYPFHRSRISPKRMDFDRTKFYFSF